MHLVRRTALARAENDGLLDALDVGRATQPLLDARVLGRVDGVVPVEERLDAQLEPDICVPMSVLRGLCQELVPRPTVSVHHHDEVVVGAGIEALEVFQHAEDLHHVAAARHHAGCSVSVVLSSRNG